MADNVIEFADGPTGYVLEVRKTSRVFYFRVKRSYKPVEAPDWDAPNAKFNINIIPRPPHYQKSPGHRYPDTIDLSKNKKAPLKAQKKDQATQTYFVGDTCPHCVRRNSLRFRDVTEKPSIVDPTRINQFTRDVAVECPDRTYYSSDQLIFIRVGQLVYRGWTYETPDGRIQHMPPIPRGIPIDELRVDPPLRAPAPR